MRLGNQGHRERSPRSVPRCDRLHLWLQTAPDSDEFPPVATPGPVGGLETPRITRHASRPRTVTFPSRQAPLGQDGWGNRRLRP